MTLQELQRAAYQEARYEFAVSREREIVIASHPKAKELAQEIERLEASKRRVESGARAYRVAANYHSYNYEYSARDYGKAAVIDAQIRALNTQIYDIAVELRNKVKRL